jgi:hypothetical protein
VAWQALEEIAIYVGELQIPRKTIDRNDTTTMPPNSVMREVLDNNDTKIAKIIDEKYEGYFSDENTYYPPTKELTIEMNLRHL